jgi:Outer membrane protein beta-barrel domain
MMKNKIFKLLVCAIFLSCPAFAQHKIGFGGGLGFSRLTGDLGDNGGFGFMYGLEGKYFLTDKLAVGALYNDNILAYSEESNLLGIGSYGNTQVLALAEYFFLTKNFRPYVGVGLGYSQINTPEITITSGGQTSTIASEKKGNFGVAPRLGFMLKNFGLEFAYNLSGRTPKSELQNAASGDKKFSFTTFKLKYVYDLEF